MLSCASSFERSGWEDWLGGLVGRSGWEFRLRGFVTGSEGLVELLLVLSVVPCSS